MRKDALLIGDHSALEAMEKMLHDTGFEVTWVSDMGLAVGLLKELEWGDLLQLVVCELQADHSGSGLLQSVRKKFRQCATILLVDSSRDSQFVSGKMPEGTDAILYIPAEPGSIECAVEFTLLQAVKRQQSAPVSSV